MEIPSRSKQGTRTYYNKLSRVYDFLAESSEGPIKAIAAAQLAPRAGEHVLEIGCGTGHVLAELAAPVGPSGRVFGIDLSEGMLAVTRERLRQTKSEALVDVTCADAMRLPFRGATFDAAFMSFTLELFDEDDAPRVLQECSRVLKPGGRIAVASVSTNGPHGVSFEIYEWTHRHFPTLVDCRPIAVAALLAEAGFRVTSTTAATMWVPVEIVVAETPATTPSPRP